MQSAVLYEKHVPWLTGEHETARDIRVACGESGDTRERFPGFVPGRVISIVSADKGFSPGETAHPVRAVAKLDLTDEARQGLLSHCSRLRLGVADVLGIDPVVFDEKWGAIAAELKVRFPLDYLVREKEEEEEEAAALVAFQAETEDWHVSAAEATELGLTFTTSPPTPPELPTAFRDTAVRLTKLLPPTVVHSGAGLYKVDGAGSTHNDTIAGFRENLLLQSNAFDITWSAAAITPLQDEIGPDGTTSAWTVADDSAAASESLFQPVTITADGNRKCESIYIKKTTAAASFPGIYLYMAGGTTVRAKATLNTDTGVVVPEAGNPAPFSGVESVGDYWRFWVGATNINNTTLQLIFYPAVNTDGSDTWANATTGFCVIYGAQAEEADTPSEYIPTTTTSMHAVLLTTGGLVEDERNGEVLVTGGNSYPVIKAYPAQVNVVGDPTGEAGALTISPYTTIQSALDQLWTDQGSAAFTANQYIRIFAGTYVENVVANAALDPDEVNGYRFIIEGNPLDDRDNSVIAPVGGDYAIFVDCDSGLIRHLKLAGTPTTYGIRMWSGGTYLEVCDCNIYQTGLYGIISFAHVTLVDCEITATQYGAYAYIGDCVVQNTKVKVTTSSTARVGIYAGRYLFAESTVVSLAALGSAFQLGKNYCEFSAIRNCTVYGGDKGVALYGSRDRSRRLDVFNTVFKDTDYPVSFSTRWPDGDSGMSVNLRNNCYHGYTAFAYGPAAATKTYTEFIALNRVDAEGDLDATDPLLTDPGSGDFSLQAGSPCRHKGVGAGVTKDVDGDAFDPYHPDIGAVSTGIGPNVAHGS